MRDLSRKGILGKRFGKTNIESVPRSEAEEESWVPVGIGPPRPPASRPMGSAICTSPETAGITFETHSGRKGTRIFALTDSGSGLIGLVLLENDAPVEGRVELGALEIFPTDRHSVLQLRDS